MKELIVAITDFVTKFVSKFSRPEMLINDSDVSALRNNLKNGDILVSRVNYELSNFVEKILTGSFWGHAAIYLNGFVYEAVTGGVRKVSLEKFSYIKDGVGICRLHGSDWTPEQITNMVNFCEDQLGESYDFSLEWGTREKWYCSKYVYFALESGNAGEVEAIETMTTLGLKTVAPQNVWDSTVQILQVGYKE